MQRAKTIADFASRIVTSQDELCIYLRCDRRGLLAYFSQGMPRREVGPRKYEYDVPACFAWLMERRHGVADESDDPLLSAGSSPALERYREEKAIMARLDRMEREGSLLPRDKVHSALGRLGMLIRNAGESLQRLPHGTEAFEVLDDAIDEFLGIVRAEFGDGIAVLGEPLPGTEAADAD